MVHVRGSAHHDAQVGQTPRPDTSDRWQRLFHGQESELRQLRRWLTALLPDRPARDDLISVAVELGTNAIQHTSSGQGGWFKVEVTCRGAVARIDVTDEGAPCGPHITDDPLSDSGRGLIIVRALSESCGVRGDSRGRTVWAEVAWAPEAAAAPEPAAPPVALPDGYRPPNGHLNPNGRPAPNGRRFTSPVVPREASASRSCDVSRLTRLMRGFRHTFPRARAARSWPCDVVPIYAGVYARVPAHDKRATPGMGESWRGRAPGGEGAPLAPEDLAPPLVPDA